MKNNIDLYRPVLKSMLGRYAVYGVNLLSMMILARIFTPEVFGTVAAISVFYVFFQLMAEAGLGPAIINLSELEKNDRDGLFGLTLIIGFLLSLLFLALGPVFLLFYNLPRVDEVVPYIAVSIVFFSASIVPSALLLREQEFYKIANGGLFAEVISTSCCVVLARHVDPLYALSAKGTISAFVLFCFSWFYSARTQFGLPMLGRKFSAIKPLLGFSGYQLGFNFINFFSRNLDNILVGKYMGAGLLGVYDKAYQLMKYPLMLLTFAMTPAIQPVIRKYMDEPHKVEEVHRDFTFKLSVVGAVAGLAMYIFADWIILIALGGQWLDVVPIIKILSIAVPVQVVLSTSGSFFQGMNRADLLFLCGSFGAVIMVSAIAIGIMARDIEVLCWLLVVAFHINFLQAYHCLYKKVFNAPLRYHLIRMIPAGIIIIGLVLFDVFIRQG